MERLQKVIANSGYTSRRKAEELIEANHVTVNGEIVNTLGFKVSDKDIICIDGNMIAKNNIKEYYLLNKPREVICSVEDDKGRKTVVDLISTNSRIYPVGRLDYDTTGLIILTNDGDLANILMHPKRRIYKTYIAKINGILNEDDFKKMRKEILIDDRKLLIDNVKVRKIDKIKNTSLVEVTIHEGRNHIVRKLFEKLGYDVMKLTRSKFAFLTDDGLKSGEYRELSTKEVKLLYSLK
ncbi:MAG: rRNA pseudouridine synthase [Firmicutes bacterium]|nr:rRNA pseudouridine synthase [Bacillota bacterium]